MYSPLNLSLSPAPITISSQPTDLTDSPPHPPGSYQVMIYLQNETRCIARFVQLQRRRSRVLRGPALRPPARQASGSPDLLSAVGSGSGRICGRSGSGGGGGSRLYHHCHVVSQLGLFGKAGGERRTADSAAEMGECQQPRPGAQGQPSAAAAAASAQAARGAAQRGQQHESTTTYC